MVNNYICPKISLGGNIHLEKSSCAQEVIHFILTNTVKQPQWLLKVKNRKMSQSRSHCTVIDKWYWSAELKCSVQVFWTLQMPECQNKPLKKKFQHDLSWISEWHASLYKKVPQRLSCQCHIFSSILTNTTLSYSAVPQLHPHGTGSVGDVSQLLTRAFLIPF